MQAPESGDMTTTMTASHTSLLRLASSEQSLKLVKQERSLIHAALSSRGRVGSASFEKVGDVSTTTLAAHPMDPPPPQVPTSLVEAAIDVNSTNKQTSKDEASSVVSPDEGAASHGSSNLSLSDVPEKSSTFKHLQQKYAGELEYMLREFQKLERQLLGAETLQANESAGSKERREKLHSFILHLQDTMQQIQTGCDAESIGKQSLTGPIQDTLMEKPAKDKEGENVQKIEEHILANLLPVKVRLKKQLAAQQGAKHNPAAMPVRGVADTTKPVSDALVTMPGEQERSTHFGKPLAGGGSILTKKLHGDTLGSQNRAQGHRVGKLAENEHIDKQKILYAGMALGSNQMKSSISAASAVHRVIIHDPSLLDTSSETKTQQQDSPRRTSEDLQSKQNDDSKATTVKVIEKDTVAQPPQKKPKTCLLVESSTVTSGSATDAVDNNDIKPTCQLAAATVTSSDSVKSVESDCLMRSELTAEERHKIRKKKRKKKLLILEQQKQSESQLPQHSSGSVKRKKSTSTACKKRGPRAVEYICALCNEVYNSTCDYNPWWALTQHDCPKCRKNQVSFPSMRTVILFTSVELILIVLLYFQIPRIDIGAPANAIEYHPALLAHADENASATTTTEVQVRTATVTVNADATSDLDSSDLSDDDMTCDESLGSEESETEALSELSPPERAELERFGAEYDGPALSDESASRLLVLMLHASTCPCRHQNPSHRDTCRSMKWMMLHVRDCPGTTATFDVCPFPWCRKMKHFLYHLVTCLDQERCQICSAEELKGNLAALRGLNTFRLQQTKAFPERLKCCSVLNKDGMVKVSIDSTSKELQQVLQSQSVSMKETGRDSAEARNPSRMGKESTDVAMESSVESSLRRHVGGTRGRPIRQSANHTMLVSASETDKSEYTGPETKGAAVESISSQIVEFHPGPSLVTSSADDSKELMSSTLVDKKPTSENKVEQAVNQLPVHPDIASDDFKPEDRITSWTTHEAVGVSLDSSEGEFAPSELANHSNVEIPGSPSQYRKSVDNTSDSPYDSFDVSACCLNRRRDGEFNGEIDLAQKLAFKIVDVASDALIGEGETQGNCSDAATGQDPFSNLSTKDGG